MSPEVDSASSAGRTSGTYRRRPTLISRKTGTDPPRLLRLPVFPPRRNHRAFHRRHLRNRDILPRRQRPIHQRPGSTPPVKAGRLVT